MAASFLIRPMAVQRCRGTPPAVTQLWTGAKILNYGRIDTDVQDPRNKDANYTQFEAPLTNEKRASIHDNSGQLQATAVTNYGTFTVAPSASLTIVPGPSRPPPALPTMGSSQTTGQSRSTRAQAPQRGHRPVARSGATRSSCKTGRRSSINREPVAFS